jgi:hypothetical protein
MSAEKHHFRKVYKSDHLGVADLEEFLEDGKKLIFTIKQVKQEVNATVAGKKGNFNIAYFQESIKPLVLNATNAKQIKLFTGSSFVEDWVNVRIELYCDEHVKMKGETVGGVRIKQIQPRDKVKPQFTEANFEAAKKAKASIELIKNSYSITPEMEQKYLAHGITATATA